MSETKIHGKKIDLRNYQIKTGRNIIDPKTKEEKPEMKPYEVKKSIIQIMFHQELKLDAIETIKVNKVATKIEECQEDHIVLTAEEYQKITRGVDIMKGFSRHDVEFIERVKNAETVELQEKPKADDKPEEEKKE